MNVKQILLLLKLRWWLVLTLFTLIVGAAAAFSLVMPKQYTATTSIVLDTKIDPVLGAFLPNIGNPGFVATQASTINSERVAGRVVKMLGLAESPSAVEQWREATQGRVTLESYYGELLLLSLRVDAVPQSSILAVSFSGKDPKFSAAVANAFAKGYLDLLVDMNMEGGREAMKGYDELLRTQRSELQVAQDRLAAFKQKKGIIVTDQRLDTEQQRLTSLDLALASAMAQEATSISRQVTTGTETTAEVQQNPVVQGLKAQLAAALTRLEEVSAVYGNRHPQWIQVDTQIKGLRSQLKLEIDRIAGATQSTVATSKRQTAELRGLVDQQKRTVLSLQADRDEVSGLVREVEALQKAYDGTWARRAEAFGVTRGNQTPAKVLSPAVEPLMHSKPNVPKNIALAVVMGLLTGLVAAIALEFRDRRVRSEDDMLVADGVPVIGVISAKPLDARTRILPAPVRHRLGGAMPPQLSLDGSAS